MHLRLATLDDARAISGLILPLAEKYIAHEFSPDAAQLLLGSLQEDRIRECLGTNIRYHLAESGDRLAGVIGVRDNRHLYHLFVAEPFQGCGLARALWNTARAAALAVGNPGEFTVSSSRFAVGLYRKFGFVETGPPEDRHGVVSVPMRLVLP